jgi:hypothetical protein
MWHVETGRWIIAHGMVPRADMFSHTEAGQPWIDMEWLAQILMAAVYLAAGWPGLVVLASLTVAATYALLVMYCRRAINPWAAALLGLAAIWFASFHFTMRPHLLALPILVIWTGELARFAHLTVHERVPGWHVFRLMLLMVLWANVHGSFIMGPAIAVGMGFPLLGAASAIVALANPYGWGYYEMVLWQFQHMDVMRVAIIELRPVSAYTDAARIAALLIALALMLWQGVRLPFMRAAMLCGLAFMALQHWRGLAFFAVTAPIIACVKRS